MLDKLERVFGRFAIANVTLYIIIGQVFVLLAERLTQLDTDRLLLIPTLVAHGEVWRLVTFIFIPPAVNFESLFSVAMVPFTWWVFYLMGSALEHQWGAFRYNVFLLTGLILTAAAAFLTPDWSATYLFLTASVFLAFAWLNPDFELSIFFILPVKVKWLALATWVYGVVIFVKGDLLIRCQLLAAVGNFLLFFGKDIFNTMRYRRRQMKTQAQRIKTEAAGPVARHRCHVCGKTDVTNPEMDFRYCSKCAGDQCYCPEHIANHEHVLTDGEAGQS